MKIRELLYEGAQPGANLGGDFTASIPERQLLRKKPFLEKFVLSLKGDLAAASTVAIETFLTVLDKFVVKRGNQTLIQLNGKDLVALQAFLTKSSPKIFEGAAGEDDKVLGIIVPVHERMAEDVSYSWSATRKAVVNVSGEVLEVAADWDDEVRADRRFILVEQPVTLPAGTGLTSLNLIVPKVGELLGLVLFLSTVPSSTTDTGSIQRLKLTIDGVVESQYNLASMASLADYLLLKPTDPLFDTLNNYYFIDFRESPINAVERDIGFIVDVQTASDPIRLIPVLQQAH